MWSVWCGWRSARATRVTQLPVDGKTRAKTLKSLVRNVLCDDRKAGGGAFGCAKTKQNHRQLCSKACAPATPSLHNVLLCQAIVQVSHTTHHRALFEQSTPRSLPIPHRAHTLVSFALPPLSSAAPQSSERIAVVATNLPRAPRAVVCTARARRRCALPHHSPHSFLCLCSGLQSDPLRVC